MEGLMNSNDLNLYTLVTVVAIFVRQQTCELAKDGWLVEHREIHC